MGHEYIIEMLNITKDFPGIRANDNITLQLRKGEIHALLGENGAGKSTLMSILFGLYQPTSGVIKKNGQEVKINTPNDANDLNIGMVHQHFKLVECFSVLDNIILGVEPTRGLFLEKKKAREKVLELSNKYGLMDPKYIEVWGKFTPRGGISIDPYCNYGKPGTRWEEVAFERLTHHDLYPEKVDNR